MNLNKITTFFALIFYLTSLPSVLAKNIDPLLAVQEAVEQNLAMPEPYPDGRVQTLNKKGAMSPQLDKISSEFVNFAAQPNKKVLEIGAGYGLACTEALKLGAKSYTANDLDARHLNILAKNVAALDKKYLSYIHLISGSFPHDLKIKENYYDAILIARVLHFMTPEELTETLQASYKMLKPNGKVYAVMLSPYVKGYAAFIPEFEKRIQNQEPNPGYIENLLDFSDATVIPKTDIKETEQRFFFFDKRTAKSYFEKNGFVIEKNLEMPLAYPSKIWQLDGRENIGIIGKKY